MLSATDSPNKISIIACPWCNSSNLKTWGTILRGFSSKQCSVCSLIFIENPFNEEQLKDYYRQYFSHTHQANQILNHQRKEMYRIELDLIQHALKTTSIKILDVGCSGGYFLDEFKTRGFKNLFGVEFGHEAALEAKKKYHVTEGLFPNLKFEQKFDLIIFRGVIEHVPNPKNYLKKAHDCLSENGLIYITSTPNANCLSAKVFESLWNQHVPEVHLMHFNTKHFYEYFNELNYDVIIDKQLYEETPYASPLNDIKLMHQAIQLKEKGQEITFSSPPFWGNMMSLLLKKNEAC